MKYLIPIVVLVVVAASIFALIMYKKSSLETKKPAQAEVASEKITGDPNDSAQAFISAANSEEASTIAENDEASDVEEDVKSANSVGDVYTGNEI